MNLGRIYLQRTAFKGVVSFIAPFVWDVNPKKLEYELCRRAQTPVQVRRVRAGSPSFIVGKFSYIVTFPSAPDVWNTVLVAVCEVEKAIEEAKDAIAPLEYLVGDLALPLKQADDA